MRELTAIFLALTCLALPGKAQYNELINTDWFEGVLIPNVNADIAFRSLDGAEYDELILGGHDPGDDFVVQGLEPNLSLRTEHIEGFANWLFFYDGEEWDDENEEAFLKLVNLPNAPEGTEIRGGRMLTRNGIQNTRHTHAWEWRDNPMVNTAFLGDEGLVMEGADLTVPLNFGRSSAFTIGLGRAREHDHGHGDEDEHGHDDEHGDDDHDDEDGDHHDEEEEHHDEDEHGHDDEDEHGHDDEDEHGHDDEDEHGHGEEELAFAEDLITARLTTQWGPDDFNQFQGGVSTAIGEDEEGGDLMVHGIDLTYTWRENGFQPGGRQLVWGTEVMLRDSDEADDQQFGIYTRALYRMSDPFEVGLRMEALEGGDADEDTAWRVSPLAVWRPTPLTAVRLQGNYTELPNGEDAQSVILGLSMSLSDRPEVR